MNSATDRGGPFVRQEAVPRNWMRASAPGIAFRFPPDESSPIGGAAPRATPTAPAAGGRVRLKRAWTLVIALLVVTGSLAFGQGAYIYAKAGLAQALLQSAWARERATGVPARPWPWADTHPVARLTAPALGEEVLVLAGATGRTLAFGPGHLDGSAQPGDPGNAVITAHRDTHFRFLRLMQQGDEIAIERADGATRHFRIRRTYVADHRTLALPRDTEVPTVTLVTCYPFDALNPGGPLRYVVVAEAA
ncbi:MAG: class GN sortase [Burkholderiales bacterium]